MPGPMDPQRLAAVMSRMGSQPQAMQVPQTGAAMSPPTPGLPPGMPQKPPMPMQYQPQIMPGQGQMMGGRMGGGYG